MAVKKSGMWAAVKSNIHRRMVSGILLLIPFVVTLAVLKWLFQRMTNLLHPVVRYVLVQTSEHPATQAIPQTYISISVSALSIIAILFLIYLTGVIGRLVVGKHLLSFGESLMMRIPLVRTIYTATKQVVQAISLPDKAAFKSVVLIEFPKPGFRAVGFLAGHIKDSTGENFCKVFIPTTRNPTTGFFEIIPEQEVVETDMAVEDGFKIIISGGILSPDVILPARAKKST